MAQALDCPDCTILERFALGRAIEPEIERLALHLEQCDACTAALGKLIARDLLTEAVHAQQTLPALPRDHRVSSLIERIAGLATQLAANPPANLAFTPSSASSREIELSFLAPPAGPDELGRLGGYRVLKVLGAGGMAIVFEAEDPGLRRRVALKAMIPTLAVNPAARQRFLREARAVAALQHPHIVPVYQVGEDRGVLFLAMPLLQGETLEDRLQKSGRLPTADVLRIGREVAAGLAVAHSRGLIHRDVKPANVWLEGTGGVVKLLDFGVARDSADSADLTETGTVLGTPSYMAPEQARGEPADARSDLFSLGCVLYRLATGTLPFRGTDTTSRLAALVLDQPVPPMQLNPAIPVGLERVLLNLLQKIPGDRPQAASAVVDALEAMISEREVTEAGGVMRAAPSRPTHAGGRRPGFFVAVALLLTVCVLVFGQIVIRLRDRQGRETVIPVAVGTSIHIDTAEPASTKPKVSQAPSSPLPSVVLPPKSLGPLAELDPEQIPAEERFNGQPPEVEAILRVSEGAPVQTLAFSADGRRLVTGSGDKTARVWEVTGTSLRQQSVLRKHSQAVSWVALSPDGNTLITLAGVARMWDLAEGEPREVAVLSDTQSTVHGAAFSPDGQTLATVGYDQVVRLWKVVPEPQVQTRLSGHTIWLGGATFSANAKLLCTMGESASGGEIRLWDLSAPEPVSRGAIRAEGHPTSSTFAAGDRVLAIGSGSGPDVPGRICLYDLSGDAPRRLSPIDLDAGPVTGLSTSPDGKSLASSWRKGRVVVFRVGSGDTVLDLTLPMPALRVVFAPDGWHVATAHENGTVCILRIPPLKPPPES